MRSSVRDVLDELERHGVRLLPDGRLELGRSEPDGRAPASLLMRAHRHRRALTAALRRGKA
ncbi:hypothetical protein [Arenibaculum sp.]|jgi:hypothetical protein|uniref:hypothetical protein n=1 Tax=Arenibaculum sp. TaxID=2865862 RepID=UPI002E14C212|nr:hypothetical protein [Arenibaculum sp.]